MRSTIEANPFERCGVMTLLHRSRLFFEDLPEIHRRREEPVL